MKFINQIFLTVFFGSFFVFSSIGSAEVLDLALVNQSGLVQGDSCVQSSEGSEVKAEKELKARKQKLRKKRSFWTEVKALFSGLTWLGLGWLAMGIGAIPIFLGYSAFFMAWVGASSYLVTGTLLAIPVVTYAICRFSKALYNPDVRAQIQSIKEKLVNGDFSELERSVYERQLFIRNIRKFIGLGFMAGVFCDVFFVSQAILYI